MTFNYVLSDKEVKDFDENYGTKLFSLGKGFLSLLNGEVTVSYGHGHRDSNNKGYVFVITIMNGPLANREIIQKKEIGSAIYSEVLKLAEQFKKNQDEKTKAQIINEDDLIKRLASEGPVVAEPKKAEPKKAEPKKAEPKKEDKFSAKFVSVDEKGNKVEKTFDNKKDFDNYILGSKVFDSSLDGLFKDIFKFEEVYNYQEKTEKSGNETSNSGGNKKGWWMF